MIHNSDVTVFFTQDGEKTGKQYNQKNHSVQIKKWNLVVPKEIMSNIHPSQNTHHTTLIKYRFVLQTKMSWVCVMPMSFLSWCAGFCKHCVPCWKCMQR